ncbi:MAG: GNAT family N-acetyltransferase [Flavobacteriia bacterium]|nr:GNAT family N-acetyltransferase [Flavobacteriia bacterium]
MTFQTLEKIDLHFFTENYNLAFSDYIVPIKMSIKQLRSKINGDRIALNLSVGTFKNEQLIGAMLIGIDTINGVKTAYNAGTGVIPSMRGNQITEKMYAFILPYLRKKGIEQSLLEVILENPKAIYIYEKIGYKVNRIFNCFKGNISISSYNTEVGIKSETNLDWNEITAFWDWNPSWQNNIAAVESLKSTLKIYGAYLENIKVGYLIFNPINNKVVQFAVAKKHRKTGVACALFKELNMIQETPILVVNTAENSNETNYFLNSIGLRQNVQQYEMILKI